ncbi:2-dehydro-3-deoxygluconokinase [Saonia flava]|uniref:2-dehydro-3-deoxygluconokinase n=1 Tax=Saonia flava TaxID=523696 RepID=A0A846QSJ8_9FLAO|nr:sugar kinase [Saonia flava]NJB71946.1 2-dehydro-3-deoxygluconokinase [Saonia flava]
MSFLCFGEIMLRLTPNDKHDKIFKSNMFQANYAGSESNVASSLALLGNQVQFVSKLPNNQLGDSAISSLQSYGVDTSSIIAGGNRIGTYFIELGSSIRPSKVLYDRTGSAISEIKENEFDWNILLKGKKWLFVSGITPALSKQCLLETIKIVKTAKTLGVKVSFDMNYRRTLWSSSKKARSCFDQILENTDLLFGNIGVLKDVYNMDFKGSDDIEKTIEAISLTKKQFGIAKLAFTCRNHLSASLNEISGVYLEGNGVLVSKRYTVNILDRFGTGDAFAAAFLHATEKKWDSQKRLEYAAAAFALKHTINGDQHLSNENEIIHIMNGNISGHVLR